MDVILRSIPKQVGWYFHFKCKAQHFSIDFGSSLYSGWYTKYPKTNFLCLSKEQVLEALLLPKPG